MDFDSHEKVVESKDEKSAEAKADEREVVTPMDCVAERAVHSFPKPNKAVDLTSGERDMARSYLPNHIHHWSGLSLPSTGQYEG